MRLYLAAQHDLVEDGHTETAKVAGMACRDHSTPIRGARIAIQGFGNVGSHAARHLAEMGGRIVAVSDVHGGIANPHGIDVPALLGHLTQGHQLNEFRDAESVTNAELLALDCDILIPAAMEGAIDCDNAEQVSAKVIVEAANMPVTMGADEVLD